MRSDLTETGVAARLKSERATVTARRLRREATPAEKTLWYALRRLPLAGSHFRRQTPMGPFIADFVCHGARLVIEVDGGSHDSPDVERRDMERQAWIEGRGYCVLRFTNARVLANVRAVADEIFAVARHRMKVRE
ncbi:endonuclease domain-containing protein [Terricaulis sp.]|uniref:endonuclease domain-containing protein n=1 Tax=Terricaulis sp. TaxID=2768686 RepID=UPI0037846558